MHLTTIQDQIIVLTGKIALPRADIEARIVAAGGKVAKSVNSKTDLLVVGASPGSKYDKAVQLGIPVLEEDELLELLAGKQIEVLTVVEEHASRDTPLTELFGEIRSLLQAPPSKHRWSAIVHLIDRCAPSQLDALCEYIQGFMTQWDVRIPRDEIDHEFSEKMREAWYKIPTVAEQAHDIAPEFRLVPDHWMGELGQGVCSAKYSLPRALDLRDSKLSSTAIGKMLDHQDLTHLNALVLPRKSAATRRLVQSLADHPTLAHLTLGGLNQTMLDAFATSEGRARLDTLNLSSIHETQQLIDREHKILAAPMVERVHTLMHHSQLGPSEERVHALLHAHPERLPALRTLQYTRSLNPKALRHHLITYPGSFERLTTLGVGRWPVHHRQEQSEKLWRRFTLLELPASITTLDISGVQFIVPAPRRGTPPEDRTQKEDFLRHVLSQLVEGHILKHIETLKLGIHGHEVEVIDCLETYAPHIKRA